MRSIAEIVALYHERKKNRAPEFAIAQDVRDHYNADVVIPLPELEKGEKPAVANLLALGLDQTAMRIASTQPDPLFAPVRPGFDKHEKDALDRRKAVLNWWDMNDLDIKDGRAARHFIGYSNSPRIIVPDFKRKIPMWELRDPLMTYPAPSSDPDCMTPDDCIFAYHKSLRWLRDSYPDAFNAIARRRTWNEKENLDELFEIIEYIDDEWWVLGVVGAKRSSFDDTIQGAEVLELLRTPNKAGVCTAVIPGRITLDRPQGQYDGMLGMYQQQAMLQALSVIATKKGIFKDEWLIARQGEVPRIIKMADGINGVIGEVQGADIREMSLDPSYMTPQMIDRLERYQRVEGGVPAQFGGENPSNVRTGRASDGTLGATIDFTVQEAQKVLARARLHENKRAIAIDKGYWRKPKSFYVQYDGEWERLDYKPEDLWTTDEHRCEYSRAGVDENGRTIEVGQLLGMGLIPKSEGRRMHPAVRNPDQAGAQVIKEQLEQAVLSALQQTAADPAGTALPDIARIGQLVTQQGTDLISAVMTAHQEAQERQAAVDQQGNPATVDPNSPEAQTGIAMQGQGAEAAASIQGPNQDMSNFANLLARLRQPQMTMKSERPPVNA